MFFLLIIIVMTAECFLLVEGDVAFYQNCRIFYQNCMVSVLFTVFLHIYIRYINQERYLMEALPLQTVIPDD